jgi:hypothetical protein
MEGKRRKIPRGSQGQIREWNEKKKEEYKIHHTKTEQRKQVSKMKSKGTK